MWVWGAMTAVLCVLMVTPTLGATPGPVPWGAGQVLDEGWTVSALKRHPEFVRLTLSRGDVDAQIEHLVEVALRVDAKSLSLQT